MEFQKTPEATESERLISEIRDCRICANNLPHEPRPVVQFSQSASILVAGQAPGRRVHETGVPFNDPSGDRLRDWMGIDRKTFYDPQKINIVPMGFCYPGTDPGKGDLPPRPECADTWHPRLMEHLANVDLILVIGAYAHRYHLGAKTSTRLADTVERFQDYGPRQFPLPHPSPRNRRWFAQHPWFEQRVIPALRRRIKEMLAT
ncbi:MAG: uracil-DNA glycosylase family protein [Pseudomonadota bacterium]